MPQKFVHLHNHSEFSLLDGASKIKDMVKYAVDQDMPALAITDHGTMYGAVDFYNEATEVGLKPILGVELYVSQFGVLERGLPEHRSGHHLVALAKNQTGYLNLMQLATKASCEGMYYKPRVDKDMLQQHHEGIIICSACMGGELAQKIMTGDGLKDAIDAAAWYRELFGDDYYLEVQGHHAEGQREINENVKRISRHMGIKMVATNDSHYLKAEDANAHDVLVCINTGSHVNDPDRMRYDPKEFYVKSYDEMMGSFENFAPDAIENTLEVADKCDLTITMGRAPLPTVPLPEGETAISHMSALAWQGLDRRLPKASQEHRDRLAYELSVIDETKFSEYFLIVRDIALYSRESDIFFGVRGSAAGSLASYCLGITDIDPIEYDLTFERFLNRERVQMPDVDMDFEDYRRVEVIAHVTEKYGAANVAYLTTFNKLGARAAIKDVARVTNVPIDEANRISDFIPEFPVGCTITKAIEENNLFRQEYETNPYTRNLIDTALSVEGLNKSAGVHAAGVMISDVPLTEYTPLCLTKDGRVATQYPHSSLEALGLLKMDFLGLSNLTIMHKAVRMIEANHGVKVDIWGLPLGVEDDRAKRTYDMLGRGETAGVFQLESDGMRKHIIELKPTSVKELQALVALYRPGPMLHIPRYIRGKYDPDSVSYVWPCLEAILAPTYGVIVYQDQVLKIAQAIAGFSLGKADLMRRAMGKKKAYEMEAQKVDFLAGAIANNVPQEIAEKLFADIEPFAGYAFNGAHAACYGMLAYQTAYLKANYPAEYIAALLCAFPDKAEKIASANAEAARMGVTVRPPDVNGSDLEFSVSDSRTILFGFSSIRGIGETPAAALAAERAANGPYLSVADLCTRAVGCGIGSQVCVQALIKAGALKSVSNGNRREMLAEAETAWESAKKLQKLAAKKLPAELVASEPIDSLFGGSESI